MVFKPRRSYSWSDGFGYDIDADIVGGVCEQIETEEGSVTKERFLEVSRPDNSPTHELFEWDDAKAAEAYRLDTSRRIIYCLRVTYINSDNKECNVKAFVNVSEFSEKTQYESIELVLKQEDKKATYLARIKQELNNYIQRNSHVEELADILIDAGEKLKKERGNK